MENMTRWRVETFYNLPYSSAYTPKNILVSLILGGYFIGVFFEI